MTYKFTRQTMHLGTMATVTAGFGCLLIDIFQRIHGFTHPLFLVIGLLVLVSGIPLYIELRQRQLNVSTDKAHAWVYVTAALFAAVCSMSNVSVAIDYVHFPRYLHVRAWLFTVNGFLTVFLYSACLLSPIRFRRPEHHLDIS